MKHLISVCIVKGYGTPDEYAHAERGILGALARASNRERHFRHVTVSEEGKISYGCSGKKPREPYLVSSHGGDGAPGNWLMHQETTRNDDDAFVQMFVMNPKLVEDARYKESLKYIKVSKNS